MVTVRKQGFLKKASTTHSRRRILSDVQILEKREVLRSVHNAGIYLQDLALFPGGKLLEDRRACLSPHLYKSV
jgi:hypothetical protein